ncbi:MAG TPA: hypothetical protein VK681_09400, partial [Reyranella sp.]|nr:hypothetical protein [Reyranella sp.]
ERAGEQGGTRQGRDGERTRQGSELEKVFHANILFEKNAAALPSSSGGKPAAGWVTRRSSKGFRPIKGLRPILFAGHALAAVARRERCPRDQTLWK